MLCQAQFNATQQFRKLLSIEQNPPISEAGLVESLGSAADVLDHWTVLDQVINAGVVPRFVQWGAQRTGHAMGHAMDMSSPAENDRGFWRKSTDQICSLKPLGCPLEKEITREHCKLKHTELELRWRNRKSGSTSVYFGTSTDLVVS